jgi:hypothetical protein
VDTDAASTVPTNPLIPLSAVENALRWSVLAVERAEGDAGHSGDRRGFGNDSSLVAGVSVQLPVVRLNHTGVIEPGRRRQQAEFQFAAAKTHVKALSSGSTD